MGGCGSGSETCGMWNGSVVSRRMLGRYCLLGEQVWVLLQGSVVEGGGLPAKGRLRSSVQLHQRASVRYVACLIHV